VFIQIRKASYTCTLSPHTLVPYKLTHYCLESPYVQLKSDGETFLDDNLIYNHFSGREKYTFFFCSFFRKNWGNVAILVKMYDAGKNVMKVMESAFPKASHRNQKRFPQPETGSDNRQNRFVGFSTCQCNCIFTPSESTNGLGHARNMNVCTLGSDSMWF
jgi:hypothetical protein